MTDLNNVVKIRYNKTRAYFILAGGYGKRLWPISSTSIPKQFYKGKNQKYSTFQKTVLRNYHNNNSKSLSGSCFNDFNHHIVIIVNKLHLQESKRQLKEINVKVSAIFIEPERRNSFACLLMAISYCYNNSIDYFLLCPSDHIIQDNSYDSKSSYSASTYNNYIDSAIDDLSFIDIFNSNYGNSNENIIGS
ncbi:MAG TPA: sugar phosphate nucleotidyltransferase, partial [Candidatus Megaira endosymbiont of Hartmannula sinica]|nr:sugar phosphate nucleotidyltransferase [Candidatus Megaera endosymbiont of Hartmannula sinica]